ncbi:MAG: toll/interleukin-1 receptor domain-containing protein, partial [Brevundimonas sp.]
MTGAKYAAFISYSHKDEAVARWLHRRLESYAIPTGAAPGYGRKGLFGRRIGRVFRDREELPAGYPLSDKINEALAQSDALIVLCSPDAARSEYVTQEILEFQRLGKGGRIFPVIVGGEDHEIFPPALSETREILEADMRPGKDGRDHAALKLLAGLMGLDPYELTRREQRAQRRRLALAGAGMAVFAGLAVAAGWGFYQSAENARQARSTLHRFFVVSGERALADGDLLLAARYALAGHQLSPENAREYEVLLARAYEALGDHRVIDVQEEWVDSVAVSPDGRRIVSGGFDGTVRQWDAATGRQIGAPITVHGGRLKAVAFLADARIVLDGEDGTVRLWDAATGRQIGMLPIGEGHRFAVSSDGRRIVSEGGDGAFRLWDTTTGRQIGA